MTTPIHVRVDRRTRGDHRVWRVWWRDAAGRKRTRERRRWTRHEADAEARRAQAYVDASAEHTPWETFDAAYLADQRRRNRPSTVGLVRGVLGAFHRRTSLLWIDEANRAVVTCYLDALRSDGRRPATCNKHLRTLRAAFRWSMAVGLLVGPRGPIAENPCEGIRRMRETHQAQVIYERRADVGRLAHAMADEGRAWEAAALLAADCGLRIGEISHLTWHSVDLERGEVVVQAEQDGWAPKGCDGRLALSSRLAAALTALREEAAGRGDDLEGGRVMAAWSPRALEAGFRKRLARACQRAALPPILPHGLRRSFGTVLANEGMQAAQLQRVMRHADIKTTLAYYVRIDQRRAAQAARDRLEGAE